MWREWKKRAEVRRLTGFERLSQCSSTIHLFLRRGGKLYSQRVAMARLPPPLTTTDYSSRRTESSSEHFASDLSLLKSDALWCENKRHSDSNPWPMDPKASVLPTTPQLPTVCSFRHLFSYRFYIMAFHWHFSNHLVSYYIIKRFTKY